MKTMLMILLITLIPILSFADTYTVCPDGSGDFYGFLDAFGSIPTEEENVILEFCDGTYNEFVIVPPNWTIRSQSGNPQNCIFEYHLGSAFTLFGGTIEGFTVSNSGTALDIDSSSVTSSVRNCIVTNNTNGVPIQIDGSVNFENCQILDNNSTADFGEVVMIRNGDVSFESCVISGNAGDIGGILAYEMYGSVTVTVSNCVITGNNGWGISEFGFGNTNLYVVNSTIASNGGGGVSGFNSHLESSIVWGNGGSDFEGTGTANCSVVGTLYRGASLTGDNIFYMDPLFCGAPFSSEAPTSDGDFTISSVSVAIGPPCGQIGYFGVGCGGPVATEQKSWGELKALYR